MTSEKEAYKQLERDGVFDIRGAIFLNGKKLDPTNLVGKTFSNVKGIEVDGKAALPRFFNIVLNNLIHVVAGGSIVKITTEK